MIAIGTFRPRNAPEAGLRQLFRGSRDDSVNLASNIRSLKSRRSQVTCAVAEGVSGDLFGLHPSAFAPYKDQVSH